MAVCILTIWHPCGIVTVLLLLTCSLQQSTLQSDKSTWALANLLDSNLMHVRYRYAQSVVIRCACSMGAAPASAAGCVLEVQARHTFLFAV
jgi:hypothetical protein